MIEVRFELGQEATELAVPDSRISGELLDIPRHLGSKIFRLTSSTGYFKFLDSVSSVDGVERAEPCYRRASGTPILVGGEIVMQFEKHLDLKWIAEFLRVRGIVCLDTIRNQGQRIRVAVTKANKLRLLDIANGFHEMPEVVYAHPNFLAQIEPLSYTLYDTYHEYQPHIKKIIGAFNSASVWDFAGLKRPIKVAVIDDGFVSHEDLPGERLLEGMDFSRDNPACRSYGNANTIVRPTAKTAHGMACAGILAASHDTIPWPEKFSVISLNPYVRVIPVKIFPDCANWQTTIDDIADAIEFASTTGAEVLSNSWRFTDPDDDFLAIYQVIEYVTDYGRGNKGCLVVFGTGNEGPGVVYYPARYDESFAVGASSLADSLSVYSSYDPYYCHVDVVAPSIRDLDHRDLWSIDQMDTMGANRGFGIDMRASLDDLDSLDLNDCPAGYDDLDYLCTFGGLRPLRLW